MRDNGIGAKMGLWEMRQNSVTYNNMTLGEAPKAGVFEIAIARFPEGPQGFGLKAVRTVLAGTIFPCRQRMLVWFQRASRRLLEPIGPAKP
jgi:hypothetical protein